MRLKTYDIVIVGGGIMGSASAYYLMKADPNLRVAVIESDPTYTNASTTLSLSNVRIQFSLKENIQISQFTLEVLKRFVEILWPELAEFVPAFDTLRFRRGWAGLYAVNTLDGNAILGE